MNYPGPIESGVSRINRWVVRNYGFSETKTLARRAWRRSSNQITQRFELDPELFDDETFDIPQLTSWDLW